MTKVSVFGETEGQIKEPKKIELIKLVNSDGGLDGGDKPNGFENVTLLIKSYYCSGYDLIIAWNNSVNRIPKNNRDVYLGHWNDGIV